MTRPGADGGVVRDPGHGHRWVGVDFCLEGGRLYVRQWCACRATRMARAWERAWDPSLDPRAGLEARPSASEPGARTAT